MPITQPPDTVWARRTDLEAGVDFTKPGQTNPDKPNVILSDVSGQMIVIYGRCGNVVHAYKAETYQEPDSTVIPDSTGQPELTIVRTAIDTALVNAMAVESVVPSEKCDTLAEVKPKQMEKALPKSVVLIEPKAPGPFVSKQDWNQTANDVLMITAASVFAYLIYRSLPYWRLMLKELKAM